MIRHSTLVLLALAGALVVTATGGFGATAIDRNADATVAPDQEAYLGVETVDQTLEAGHHEDVTLVVLENRFPTEFTDVTVTVADDGNTPPVLHSYDGPRRLGIDQEGRVTASIVCSAGTDTPGTETWPVSIAASGTDASVELTRSVTVTCEPGPPRNPNSSGSPSPS